MAAGIEGQQDRQQRHQQQLNRGVGCPAGHPQQLATQGLQAIPGAEGHQLTFQIRNPALLAGQFAQAHGHHRNQLGELAQLFEHLGQQQLAQAAANQGQRSQHQQQGQGTVQGHQPPERGDQYVQGYRQHHGAEQHQQYPAQFPGQQAQHHQG